MTRELLGLKVGSNPYEHGLVILQSNIFGNPSFEKKKSLFFCSKIKFHNKCCSRLAHTVAVLHMYYLNLLVCCKIQENINITC